jgi:uncharacterized protein (DUF983 family)
MTSQTKHFIELPDVLAFRFECPKCHSFTVIPVDGFLNVPPACPNGCGKEWEETHAHGVTEAFDGLVAAIRLVQRKTSQFGLAFSLEIRESGE